LENPFVYHPEKVAPDTMDRLPSFAPYPPAKLRLSIAHAEWDKCLDAWIFLAESHLRPPQTRFQSLSLAERQSITEFVSSYVRELSDSSETVLKGNHKATTLYKWVFMLFRALLSADKISLDILRWDTLAAFAKVFQQIPETKSALANLWTKHTAKCEESFLGIKKQLMRQIGASDHISWTPTLASSLLPLLHLSPQTAAFFAIGSELVDGFAIIFPTTPQGESEKTVTVFIYLILLSLVQKPTRNISLLSDHLYSLKVDAKEWRGTEKSLLESLISNTPIIKRLKAMSDQSDSDSFETIDTRRDVTAGLLEFQSKRTWPRKQKPNKSVVAANAAVEAVHIHQMSLITQVQDLFPDLGSAFVAKLLDEYSENVEQVIAHLLDDSLPDYLASADRTEQLETSTSHHAPLPHSPLPARRNIHDGDALDTLAVSASQLRLSKGRAADPTSQQDALLPSAANKAAILAALARFDADDDERDDTYDAADVGGSVDARPDDPALRPDPTASSGFGDAAERALWRAWKRDGAAAFARDAATRKGAARGRLRLESGCTDEVLEGWGAMLAREPVRARALERRFGEEEWRGNQKGLGSRGAWREDGGEDDEDEDEEDGEARGGGFPRGGGARGGRGGAVAGPSSERGTQRARRGKEVRGSNRRNNRAKKMGRGMV
jgi:activating signal cointegrator complex subunit 2